MFDKNKKKTVLIVDDEKDLRDLLSFSLEIHGIQTHKASNGREAIEIIKANPVDIVISDIRMPGGDGIELLREAKQKDAKVPVILLMTGFSEVPLEDAFAAGAEAIFLKPIAIKPLMTMISGAQTSKQVDWISSIEQTHVDIGASLRFSNLDHPRDSRILSLGPMGMFVSLLPSEFPTVNAAVDFRIGPILGTTGETIDGKGMVRWARVHASKGFPAGCGIEFLYISDRHRKEIEDFLRQK